MTTKIAFYATAALLLFATTSHAAEQDDITFVVAGKTANHRQQADNRIDVLNYHFFAEIFLQENGIAEPAVLVTPLAGGRGEGFTDSGYALEYHGGRYGSEAELEAAYPDGKYLFIYTSPSTGAMHQSVQLRNPNGEGSGLPDPPRIYLAQAGVAVAADAIDPALDLQVSWEEFVTGSADPAGIMDDLLFVIMADCDGVRRAHSGRPFEGTPYLTYEDSSFVIKAEALLPQQIYQLSVEHAVLDTSIDNDVPAFATFATTTFLDIHTRGSAAPGQACRQIRQAFDAGQKIL